MLLALLLFAGSGRAATQMPDIVINITGTVIASSPCKINGDRVIEVNFGDDLMTSKVDGVNYRKMINYTLDCRGASSNKLRLKIQGTAASFDSTVLATERSNMGLKLWSGRVAIPINGWFPFDSSSQPFLEVVPVKAQGSTLSTGRFSAGATMVVEYQ
ncbi:MAG: fimbrial protein [Serratia marcescens]|nr:fimbrial protein [Serratia marcescens]